jgi:hypothetical protein
MKLTVKNFRSIKDETFDLAPITVFYGPNGSGKSTVLYSLLTYKNIVTNPNQRLDGFFDYGFLSLGDFQDLVFDRNRKTRLSLGITNSDGTISASHQVDVGADDSFLKLKVSHPSFKDAIEFEQKVSFPFSVSRHFTKEFVSKQSENLNLTWNGFFLVGGGGPPLLMEGELDIMNSNGIALGRLTEVGVVPLKRGFTKPSYAPLSVSPFLTSEDDIATLIAVERHFDSRISEYLESIVNREFRFSTIPGTVVYLLNSIDRATRLPVSLVNDGFGVNQLVHMLAICLSPKLTTICIEEPEIHLHPSAVRNLAQAFVKMTKEENKRFVIATQSEVLLSSLLAEVSRGILQPEDLSCYLVTKEGKKSNFEKQAVNEKGQIEGGLQSFAEAELENLKALLGSKKS